MINCSNEELKLEIKKILTSYELDENLIYNQLKEENIIDYIKK